MYVVCVKKKRKIEKNKSQLVLGPKLKKKIYGGANSHGNQLLIL